MLTKIKQTFSLYRVAALAALGLLIAASLGNSAAGQTLIEGYGSDGPLQRGMLVSIKDDDSSKIEPASSQKADKLHGVVVDANDAAVTLSNEEDRTFVATTGKYDVLVANQNGQINPGDYVAISSINGIGMRSDEDQPVVIGKALEKFDGLTGVVSTANIDGMDINIGRVKVDILVARNPLQRTIAGMPEIFSRTAEDIAGKPVQPARIYISLAIFIISTSIACSLLYGAVRNGIISVGRNPLSKKSIVQGMMQVVIVGLTIFVSGIFGVYLLLRL